MGLKSFSFAQTEIYVACILAVVADGRCSSIRSNRMVVALAYLYIVYDIHSENRRI